MSSDLLTDIPLKLRRSAGVKVTPKVHKIIEAGNLARGRGDWSAAASRYREALVHDPALQHIWIQLGHALKEMSDFDAAEAAYRNAAEMLAHDPDPWLHLAHLYKRRGDRAAATRHYMLALERDPSNADALGEMSRLLGGGDSAGMRELLALIETDGGVPAAIPGQSDTIAAEQALRQVESLLAKLAPESRQAATRQLEALTQAVREAAQTLETGAQTSTGDSRLCLIFDVSDLISYFRNARLPTGIQRVQIETIGSALRSDEFDVRICAFIEAQDDWLEIPAPMFLALARLSLSDGNRAAPEWIAGLARLQLMLAASDPIEMPHGAYLINLGTSWWLQNYFLFVRQAKARRGVRYVPFVHDLIPVMAGEHCVKELTQDFVSWAIGAFEHADHFLVNSEATKRDLLHVADILGHSVAPDDVAVIRLDADCRKPDTVAANKRQLNRWQLKSNGFVLFVSTIESRKNHLAAFDAWIALLKRHGPQAIPKLVCVGNRGWLNDAVYARLDSHAGLRDHVVMLSGLSDSELALLYQSCRFTIYPSQYEGWGLPVTESLCHGKVALVSDASSLPEAGGEFAVYFRSGHVDALIEALDKLIRDDDYRSALEQRIVEEFRPRSWRAIADDMASAAARWHALDRPASTTIPTAKLGAWHPLVRNYATTIWPGMRSAEVFRAGDGWWGPDNWGCWTKPQGGRLEIATGTPAAQIRLALQLHGIPRDDVQFVIDTGDPLTSMKGQLRPGERKWVTSTLKSDEDGVIRIEVKGNRHIDLRDVTEGSDAREVSVGVAGFFLCLAEDSQRRLDFIEALMLDSLAELDFGRRPTGSVAVSEG